jgi:hypothetical protein
VRRGILCGERAFPHLVRGRFDWDLPTRCVFLPYEMREWKRPGACRAQGGGLPAAKIDHRHDVVGGGGSTMLLAHAHTQAVYSAYLSAGEVAAQQAAARACAAAGRRWLDQERAARVRPARQPAGPPCRSSGGGGGAGRGQSPGLSES